MSDTVANSHEVLEIIGTIPLARERIAVGLTDWECVVLGAYCASMYVCMYITETGCGSNIWFAPGTESLNQLLPHHKNLYCSWLSHNTTNKAHRAADKPTLMDITQLTAVTQPPGLHGLKLYTMCRL